jgi:hypothetical protein
MATITVLNEKMREIAKRRQFTSFWEAFDYFKLASYDEVTALQIACELFDGDVWKNAINASKRVGGVLLGGDGGYRFTSGATYNLNFASSGSTTVMGIDPAVEYTREPDDVDIEVFVISNNGDKAFMPIYKAYTETRQYKEVPELESHIKVIRTSLSTELAIALFNEGYNKF